MRVPSGPSSQEPRDLSDDYVAKYRLSHLNQEDPQYRAGYWKLGVANSLLSDYRYLDVGCGTGGYFGLLSNARKIVGIDKSAKMISAAKDLARGSNYERRTGFHHGDFNSSLEDPNVKGQSFDLIRLGVFGSYEPLTVEVLRDAEKLLSSRGLILLNFSYSNLVIARTLNRDIVLTQRRLNRLLSASGHFNVLLDWHHRRGYAALLNRRFLH